ncbi:hypothetical protein [Paraburkholderia youngii]|nr:hypothetical protein [Paraburkholderia youngii]
MAALRAFDAGYDDTSRFVMARNGRDGVRFDIAIWLAQRQRAARHAPS